MPALITRSSRMARRKKGLNMAAAMMKRRLENTKGSTSCCDSLSTTNAEAHARQTCSGNGVPGDVCLERGGQW